MSQALDSVRTGHMSINQVRAALLNITDVKKMKNVLIKTKEVALKVEFLMTKQENA